MSPSNNYQSLQLSSVHKMDIFSFGVLLLEMYSNEFPDVDIRERLLQSVRNRRMVDLNRECTAEDMDTRPSASDIIRQLNEN